MKHSRRRFLAVFAAVAMTGSARNQPITRERFQALGTVAQITLVGNPAEARVAIAACRDEVSAIEAAFSLYSPNSTLSVLNRDGSVKTNKRFSTLLQHALEMAKLTRGAFDVTVQPLWQALAAGNDIHEARRHIGWRGLHLTDDVARFERLHMAASFNGIAQGFAADRVSAILKHHGFENTLVDLGEFAASGQKPDGHWRLGIRNPLTQQIAKTVEVTGGALATSEPKGTLVGGQPHIFDPLDRPGKRWASVTVEAAEAWRADALSTALAASPIHEADGLLRNGGANRAWLINAQNELVAWKH